VILHPGDELPRLEEFFEEGGLIHQTLDTFDLRPQQTNMAEAVDAAFQHGNHLIVEAPTGVGKSFAYLLPAFMHAARGNTPIIICTSTISLQEQLVYKDIPFLQQIFPKRIEAALMKGRSNYLCRRRLGQAVAAEATLFDSLEDRAEVERIERWAATPGEKTSSDLDPVPLPAVWSTVCAEHGNCLGRKCAFYTNCAWQDARRGLYNAEIVVVNYALFFNDLAMRRLGTKLLPDYKAVIFDEAHDVPRLASEHLGLETSSGQIRFLLDRLAHPRKKKGFLRTVNAALSTSYVKAAREAANEFFANVLDWSDRFAPSNKRIREPGFIRDPLSPRLHELSQAIDQEVERCETDEQATEMAAWAGKVRLNAINLEALVAAEADNTVYWLEEAFADRGGRPRIRIKSAPIDVSPILRDELFNAVDSVICTSATLSTGDTENFTYFRSRTGLDNPNELVVPSPFDLEAQVAIHLHPQLPDPSDQTNFIEQSAPLIEQHIRATSGGALVLFTSYRMLEQAHGRIGASLEDSGYTVLRQGSGMPRNRLIQLFAQDMDAVLFATSTFWQGIDVPGQALRNVIITKLPFPVPTHPLLEARSEHVQKDGRNPFMEILLPEAIVKLKQGFGRLIRRASDSGRVVILDPRVMTKRYGRLILDSLPACPIEVGDEDEYPVGGF
jgi:ATP-dependent DNA helicase DinG